MILSTQVDGVDVHASVIRPVVCQGNQQLGSDLVSGLDNLVEAGHVDGGGAVGVEPLEDHLGRTSAFTTILWKTTRDICAVLVVESPGAEDGETCLLGGGQPLFDIGLVLIVVSIY